MKDEKKGQGGEEKSKVSDGEYVQEKGKEEESQSRDDKMQRDSNGSTKETDIKGGKKKMKEKKKTDIKRDKKEERTENKTERKHHMDKGERVGEGKEKDNGTVTENAIREQGKVP